MRSIILLVIGLAIGAIGATLFLQSFPPEAGSEAARADDLDRQLTKAKNRVAALEAMATESPGLMSRNQADGMRSIAGDLRDGRPVDVNDVFQTAKPILRDLAPVFDNVRRREQKRQFEAMTAQLTEKYHLNGSQRSALKKWMEDKSEQEAARFKNLALKSGTSLEDLAKASRDIRPDDGLDAFMDHTLTGEDLARFKGDRMIERADRVQNEADRKVQKLNNMVELDSGQQDQVFALMARSSRDFDPGMQLQGLGDDITSLAPGQSRDDAILAVLRPDQRQKYEERRIEQHRQAEEKMNDIGLKLPSNWSVFDDE